MPRDASGTYTLPTGNPVVVGTPISAGWANPSLNDIAAALTGSLARNGAGGMQGNLTFTPTNTYDISGPRNVSVGGALSVSLLQSPLGATLMHNGLSPAGLQIYQTYTDASNWERAEVGWGIGTNFYLQTTKSGSGQARNMIIGSGGGTTTLQSGSATRWTLDLSGHLTPVSDSSLDIGTSSLRVRGIFVGNVYPSQVLATAGNTLNIGANGAGQWQFSTAGNILPTSTNAYDLGGASNLIRSVYIGTDLSLPAGTKTAPAIKIGSSGKLYARAGTILAFSDGTNETGYVSSASVLLRSPLSFGWSAGEPDALSGDTVLWRGGSGVMEQRNGLAAQTYRLYNTYTDVSNFERGGIRWNANNLELYSDQGGTGSSRNVVLRTTAATGVVQVNLNGTLMWGFTNNPAFLPYTDNAYDVGTSGLRVRSLYVGTHVEGPRLRTTTLTVATLPAASAANEGSRCYVSDSTVVAAGNFGNVVAGAGSNKCPVYSDGAAWRIG